ncbi:MAG: NnrS family protein [Acetobacteraceae bacterium]|nr:NnrS family protein [Pseudomonadota bacterium]
MAAIPRYRTTSAPALLSAGFRPFFLLSAVWSAGAVVLWLLLLDGLTGLPTAMPPVLWHAHEMVFGYGAATVAGFLLTAVPNWTGRMPLQGLPLGILVSLWLAGRLAMLIAGGGALSAAVDLAFPTVFLLALAREIVAGRNWRNLPVLGALGMLLLANLLMHLGTMGSQALALTGAHLGVATLLALITLIGGRIIPSFTRNWLVKRHPQGLLPAPFGAVDKAALASTVAALLLWTAAPDMLATAGLLVVAGCANLVRLFRWRGLATVSEPLLAVLHLGYAWVAVGLVLLGVSRWLPGLPPTAALHALTVGAIGTMTLAVMARASLGHTGQALTAGPGCVAVFALVTMAGVLRLAAPLDMAAYQVLLILSGLAWSSGFGLFAFLFTPLLAKPRQRQAPTAG